MILHCHKYGRICYIIDYKYINNKKLSNSNNNRSKLKFFKLLWDIVVFRLVAYLLNMICLNLRFLYNLFIHNFSHKFYTVLYQFLETGKSDRTLMGLDQLTPFHFSFTVPSMILYAKVIMHYNLALRKTSILKTRNKDEDL